MKPDGDRLRSRPKSNWQKIKAELNAKMALLDAHLKAATEAQKMQHTQAQR